MSKTPGEKGGAEPLSLFTTFEVRASAIGVAGLNQAVERSAYPQNILTAEDLNNVTPAIAVRYAKLLRGEDFNGPGASVAYNGFYFAAVVGSLLTGNLGKPTPPPYPSIFDAVQGDSQGKEKALDLQAAYLADKPTLSEWIDRYRPTLDPFAAYPEVVTTVAALTLRDTEAGERLDFIEAELHLYGGGPGNE